MNIQKQPLVSIVTPVYNEEKHLGEAIESLLRQTYQNWECIIANNCSTDDSRRIAREYAARDSRIRVEDNRQFLRAVPNFNGALRRISPLSKYCKIVFADDWIFPECLDQMVGVAEEYPSVGIVGAYGLQGRQVMWAGLPYPSRLVPGRDVCRKLFLEDLYVFGTATSLLFRADLVRSRDPFFNESNLHSDSETCLALLKTSDFGFVNQVLTFTRVRESSLFAFSTEMNTFIAGRLHDLITHGPDCLSAEEFEGCLSRKLDEYYSFLAASVFRHRQENFWEYHKAKLREAGVGFSRVRLAKAVISKLIDAALNPKVVIENRRKKTSSQKDPNFLPGFQEKGNAG
jgi:glycosyltransferase involved in cell wall biosynthesis